ncbi:alpha/beta fold hydrolase [Pseudonocardiaceae bacterium YIM PH 21723]|nr:alpha/beta fold hydrolase [Pseudonocardiaceae bacterium YIM PH 21723]
MSNLPVHFERRGSGSPLVLLHGIGHRWQAWSPVIDQLAEHHDVWAIDLPGFGQSPPMPEGQAYTLENAVQRLGEILDELGLKGAHVAGNSMGALLSLELASQGWVSSATALAPAGFWIDADRKHALRTLRKMYWNSKAPLALSKWFINKDGFRTKQLRALYQHPERIDALTAFGDLQAMRGSVAFRPTLRAGADVAWSSPAPKVPVTVAWGDHDRILLPRQAEIAKRELPQANHVTLAGCGHIPMGDDPEAVVQTILATAARAEGRDAVSSASA